MSECPSWGQAPGLQAKGGQSGKAIATSFTRVRERHRRPETPIQSCKTQTQTQSTCARPQTANTLGGLRFEFVTHSTLTTRTPAHTCITWYISDLVARIAFSSQALSAVLKRTSYVRATCPQAPPTPPTTQTTATKVHLLRA